MDLTFRGDTREIEEREREKVREIRVFKGERAVTVIRKSGKGREAKTTTKT